MGLSLQQLRDGVRKPLGVDSDDLPDSDVDLLLNQSWWQIADDLDFREKETSRTYSTVYGTADYPSSVDMEGIQLVSIEDRYSSSHSVLTPMTELLYESSFVDTTAAYGVPTHYVRRASGITLWPTPNNVYEIKELYYKTLADIAANGPPIPQSWHEIIKYGAIYRGFADFGDYNRSRAARTMQLELMAGKETPETQEKQDRPYARVQIIRPRYP